MQRITHATATPDNRFTEGNPSLGTPATVVTAAWMNGVQEELAGIVLAAGLTLDQANTAQVLLGLRRLLMPIGHIVHVYVDTNPATLYGFGTWAEIAQGRVLVGRDGTDAGFDAIGKTGGSKTHSLVAAENGPHTHQIGSRDAGGADAGGGSPNQELVADFGFSGVGAGPPATTSSAGVGAPHNNLQPYLVCRIWRRTA